MRKGKIISLILSSLFFVSALCSCNAQNEKESSPLENDKTVTAAMQSDTHYANNKERDDYIVKDGKAYYTVIIPADALDFEIQAAELLVEYYEKATGVKLNTATDDKALSYSGRYISVGDTKLLRDSGISIPQNKYGKSGFRIVTQNNNVYISGARSQLREGTLFGVQEFLYHTLNWRAYAISEIKYDKKPSVKMIDFDVVEIPDFDDRRVGYNQTFPTGGEYNNLLRYSDQSYAFPFNGHSHYQVLPYDTYYEAHPDWYYTPHEYGECQWPKYEHWMYCTQLCMSNEEMLEEFIVQLTNIAFENPEASFCHLGIMDGKGWCDCDNCVAWRNERNTNPAGQNVWFTNQVSRAVNANVQAVDPGRKIDFQCFAYYATIEPPVHKNENGDWVADHEDVIPDDNVYIQFTPLTCNGTQTLDHVLNLEDYTYLLGWDAITDNISTWLYAIDFNCYFINVKNWDVVSENWRILKEHGVNRAYMQGPLYDNVFQMYEMRLWIISKIMWNTSLSWQNLAEEFIREYYGPVAEQVQEYYDMMTVQYEKLRTVDNLSGKLLGGPTIDDAKYWPFAYVEAARSVFNDGFKDLEELKQVDVGEYDKYYWRLTHVYFENMYMQLNYYLENYSYEQQMETFQLFKTLANQYQIKTREGGTSMEQKLKEWEETINVG